MKKEKTLKYLILTFALIISFFMFSNASVKAEETKGVEIKDNLFFEVEEIEDGQYSIVGVYNTCAGDSACLDNIGSIQNLVIPDVYNDGTDDYPIVSIKDGTDGGLSGVLEDLTDIVSGKISGGNNLTTIGVCAFCNFINVNEIEISESVILIKEYAFSGTTLDALVINRYDNSSISNPVTSLSSRDVFVGLVVENVVFKNGVVLSVYKNSGVWSLLGKTMFDKFTFKITYRFYDGIGGYEDRVYFSGRKLGNVPNNLEKFGFDFCGWESLEYTGEEITENSEASVYGTNENLIHGVNPKWELKDPELLMETYYKGVKDDDNKIVYAGRENKLDFLVEYTHDLMNEDGFVVAYMWESNIQSITNTVGSNSNSYSIGFVKQSGTYTCYVTISYLTYTKTVGVSVQAEIVAKDLIIDVYDNRTEYGTYVSAGKINDKYFDNTSLIDGEIIKNYSVELYTNDNADLAVGEYPGVLSVRVLEIGYEDSTDDYSSNYNIQYNKGDLTIFAKEIDVSLIEDIEVTYGDVEVLNRIISDKVYVSQSNQNGISNSLVVTYIRADAGVKDVGRYNAESAIIDNANYSIILNSNSEYKIVIKPKDVAVNWVIDEDLVYNGTEKSIAASYNDIANQVVELKVVVKKDDLNVSLVNAGSYYVTAQMIVSNNNYNLTGNENVITIEKADSYFIGDVRQTKVYNGMPQKVDVALNHNEGMLKYGDYSTCKNAHVSSEATCLMTVSVDETDNYKPKVANYYLHINPYKLMVEPDLFKITYGTRIGIDNLNKNYPGVNGERVIVYFFKEGTTSELNVGDYNIGGANLSNNTNYTVEMIEGSGLNKLKIIPAPVEVRFYFYENLVYDGNVKEIGIRVQGTTENVGLEVNYNGKSVIKNAGEYRIDVSLSNNNYYISGNDSLEFTIAKATYDVSKLKLNDKKVNFNFKNHFINLEGTLPEGLVAVYSIDNNKGNGTFAPSKHVVKVTFEGDYLNYNYVEPLTAVLNIDMTWIWVVLISFVSLVAGIVITLVILVKAGKIRLKNRLKRSKIRKIIKRNKELDYINQMIVNKKKELSQKDEEEDLIIEEPVKFVKNPVNVPPEELVSLSFVDELFRSEYATKYYYSEVKNELLSYEGIVSKIKRDYETFYLNNMPVAKMDVVNGILRVYFALDPTLYRAEEYNHTNASKQKDFVSVPLALDVNSIDSLRHAKMFVRIIRKREKIKFVSNFIRTDYIKIYTAKDNSFRLFKKVFSKKNNRNED